MPGHQHNHHHTADWKTIASAIGEAVSQTCSSYAIGETIDFLFKLAPYGFGETIGLSEPGAYGFMIGAVWTTFGCAYSHFNVNLKNQGCDHADHHHHQPKNIQEELQEPLLDDEEHDDNYDADDEDEEKLAAHENLHDHDNEHDHRHEHNHEHHHDHYHAIAVHDHHHDAPPKKDTKKRFLNVIDVLALIGDAGGHTLEVAAPFIYAVNLYNSNNLSALGRFLTLGIGLTVGSFCAKANVTTCAHNMLDHEEAKVEATNWWTNIASAGEVFTYATSNPLWIGKFVDSAGGFAPYAISLSEPGLAIGFGVTFFTSAGSFYAHRVLNTNNQHSAAELTPAELATPLTLVQYVLIKLDFISHTSDVAPKPIFVAEMIRKNKPLSGTANLLIQLGAIAAGALCAVGTTRTCENQLRRHNYLEKMKAVAAAKIALPVDGEEPAEEEQADEGRISQSSSKKRREEDNAVELVSSSKKRAIDIDSAPKTPRSNSFFGDTPLPIANISRGMSGTQSAGVSANKSKAVASGNFYDNVAPDGTAPLPPTPR